MRKYLYILVIMIAVSCITEFEFQQHVGKDILVIEGFIADKCNESKIVLSKSTTFSNLEGVSFINDANVKVVDEIGNSNDFFFSNQAYYPVEPAFCAKKGVKYRLEVYYNEKSYHSDWVTMQQSAEIENVSWSVIDENLPVEGSCRSLVAEISTKESNDSCSRYYRYFLEETWLYVAKSSSNKIYNTQFVYKNSEEIYAFNTSFKKHDNITYCWPTSSIEGINIATTQGLAINKIEKMPVYNLNINSNGDKLLYKYSLLVKQCAISSEVYNTLRLVKDFSEDDATLFATQPGFVKGNMYNPNNKEERVIGLFYATEIKGRRIFILPHELDSKDYRIVSSLDENCGSIQIAVPNKNCPGHPSFKALKDSLSSGKNIINVYKEDQETRYILSNIPCLDCRVKGSNIKPEWWGEIAE